MNAMLALSLALLAAGWQPSAGFSAGGFIVAEVVRSATVEPSDQRVAVARGEWLHTIGVR